MATTAQEIALMKVDIKTLKKDVKEIIDKTGIMNFLIGESLLENIKGMSLLKKIVQINQ